MPEMNVDMLRRRLLRGGVAARHVTRAVDELRDHLEDLEAEAADQGLTATAAADFALQNIGATRQIAEQYLQRRELKCWCVRHRRLARLVLPVAYILALPMIPVTAGAAYATVVARWCACLLLSAFVTAGMLLAMQFSISAG